MSYNRERRVAGVSVELPRLTRVVPVAHGAYAGSTLTFSDDRQDYELSKLEAVPGIRETNPLLGAKIALPPRGDWAWDGDQLLWVAASTAEAKGSPAAESDGGGAAGFGGMRRRGLPGAHPERVGARVMAWTWDAPGAAGVARGTVAAHAVDHRDDLGGRGEWTAAVNGADGSTYDVRLHAPELRAALDLRHELDCSGEPPPLDPELEAQGWTAKKSRSTGDWYYVWQGPGGAATSQWERPGCAWPGAAACNCEGHRPAPHVDSHVDRMERKAGLVASCLAKFAEYERSDAKQTYYEWCRARCEAYYEPPSYLRDRPEADAERRASVASHVDTMFGLMREYDHVASDSEFSDESESDDDDFYEDLPPEESARKRKRRKTEKLVRMGIEAFIDSPGVASRILHGDGFNRTRSGQVFGGARNEDDVRKKINFD
jgi:hypothetical protein